MSAAPAPAADPIPLTGSSPPTGMPPAFRPVATASRPDSVAAPREVALLPHPLGLAPIAPEAAVLDLAERTAALVKREDLLSRRLAAMPPARYAREVQGVERLQGRMLRRLWRYVRRLSKLPSPTIRAAGMKGHAYIELAVARWEGDRHRDALGLSIARDTYHLALEAACRWEATSGDAPAADREDDVAAEGERVADLARREWAAVGRTIRTEERRAAHPGARSELADRAANRISNRLTRRLRAASRGLARRSAATPAALSAKARAVLAIESATASDDWWADLRDAVVRDAAALRHAPAGAESSAKPDGQDGPLSIEQVAAGDFGPFDFGGWKPPSRAEWTDLGGSILVTMRIAYQLLHKDKAATVALMADLANVPPPELNDEAVFERIDDALAFFEVYATVLNQARLRCLCAGAAAALQREGETSAAAGRSAA